MSMSGFVVERHKFRDGRHRLEICPASVAWSAPDGRGYEIMV
ncbi:MAG: hypothetical protein Q4C60_05770 [Eubacteriales bacterium]|nr:hypothetical protein [Eubacteriales bacterium]